MDGFKSNLSHLMVSQYQIFLRRVWTNLHGILAILRKIDFETCPGGVSGGISEVEVQFRGKAFSKVAFILVEIFISAI